MFWLKSLVVTSTVSSLATMPFAMYHFGRIAGWGLLANLVAMPIVSLLSAPLAAAALILSPFGGDTFALRGFGVTLEWVLSIAHTFSGGEAGNRLRFPQMPGISLFLCTGAIVAYCLFDRFRQRLLASLSLSALAVTAWLGSAADRIHWAPSGDLFLESANGTVERIAILSGDGLSPLRFNHVPAQQSCELLDPCAISFDKHQLVILGEVAVRDHQGQSLPASLTLIDPGQVRPEAPLQILWRDVLAENGVTLERRGSQFVKREKPECGKRPWQPCHSDESGPKP